MKRFLRDRIGQAFGHTHPGLSLRFALVPEALLSQPSATLASHGLDTVDYDHAICGRQSSCTRFLVSGDWVHTIAIFSSRRTARRVDPANRTEAVIAVTHSTPPYVLARTRRAHPVSRQRLVNCDLGCATTWRVARYILF